MLTEVMSDVFKEKGNKRGKIVFHKGLNTIVATESENNSTGKSSFLLAIDFAFGGKSYAQSEAKIIDNIGHHTICFAFEFGGEKFYFSRSTNELKNVNVCNEKYEITRTISIEDFCKFLFEKYGFEEKSLSLRNAISPYFRISHKSSKTLKDFLNASEKQSDRDCVVSLEKLFNRFAEIKEEKAKSDDAKKANETFKDAAKRNYFSIIKSKKELKNAQDQVNKIKDELSVLSKMTDKNLIFIDDKNSEKLRKLEKQYKLIKNKKSKLETKITITQNTLDGLNPPTSEELTVLKSYFPEINIKKVYAVEQFHDSLTAVLKIELTDELQKLKMQLNETENDFIAIKQKYESALPNDTISKASFDEYSEKYQEMQKLLLSIENYQKGLQIDENDKALKVSLNQKELTILNSIAEKINANISLLNSHINNGEWKNCILQFIAPKKNLGSGINHYSLVSANDSGDGTESANVLMFDLSVLKLTKLPAIIHDLYVRNELDDKRQEDFIKLYASENEKQIFATFRSIQNYSSQVQKIILDNAVLKLYTGGGELFGTNKWTKNK